MQQFEHLFEDGDDFRTFADRKLILLSPVGEQIVKPLRLGAFDVKPGEKYYLAPQGRVHLW